jgi:hypothetical protein
VTVCFPRAAQRSSFAHDCTESLFRFQIIWRERLLHPHSQPIPISQPLYVLVTSLTSQITMRELRLPVCIPVRSLLVPSTVPVRTGMDDPHIVNVGKVTTSMNSSFKSVRARNITSYVLCIPASRLRAQGKPISETSLLENSTVLSSSTLRLSALSRRTNYFSVHVHEVLEESTVFGLPKGLSNEQEGQGGAVQG